MSQLLDRFKDAVKAFNSGNYTASLGPLLHKDVVMNEVDDPAARPYAGIEKVLQYLNGEQTKKLPQFYYVDPNDKNIKPIESPDDTDTNAAEEHAQISGIGTYRDISNPDLGGPTNPFPVRYYFLFRKEKGSWLLLQATATRL